MKHKQRRWEHSSKEYKYINAACIDLIVSVKYVVVSNLWEHGGDFWEMIEKYK
jgi:protein tyrosine phosphatase